MQLEVQFRIGFQQGHPAEPRKPFSGMFWNFIEVGRKLLSGGSERLNWREKLVDIIIRWNWKLDSKEILYLGSSRSPMPRFRLIFG
jgi:hypothetical protein